MGLDFELSEAVREQSTTFTKKATSYCHRAMLFVRATCRGRGVGSWCTTTLAPQNAGNGGNTCTYV